MAAPLPQGWADPAAQQRLLQAIQDEPSCGDPRCPDCASLQAGRPVPDPRAVISYAVMAIVVALLLGAAILVATGVAL